MVPRRPLHRQEFQIAILCALRVEQDAVQALLDEEYEIDGFSFGKASGDLNVYTTGRVGDHHVVLAHMPGIGKANAAAVAAGIRSSFQGVRLALVVGVCGGAPTTSDGTSHIYLGDVIISTGVLQIDLGRLYPNKFVVKDTLDGNLGPPMPEVRSFLEKVSGLKACARLKAKTAKYCEQIIQRPEYHAFQHPGSKNDKMYPSTYRHKHHVPGVCDICDACNNQEDEVCEASLIAPCSDLGCDDEKLATRGRTSEHEDSSIYFGRFASGDTVLKSGQHRDALVRQHKIVAFEMEGAGIWNSIPTIIVKAASDYADSHKNKEWQGYAAIASAACAKALLEEWRPAKDISSEVWRPLEKPSVPPAEDESAACLRSLSFGTMDARLHNIRLAHQETCEWFFTTAEFQEWKSRSSLQSSNGVLWVKGNPGVGKSTLMKHSLLHCKRSFRHHSIASYFFNARGSSPLEKSPIGMFRSLLYQLLDQNRQLCRQFLPIFQDKRRKHGTNLQWHLGELRDFFLVLVERKALPPTLLFIDALDECNDNEVRTVVSFLEDLSIKATKNDVPLNICLSSRHYPHISMKSKIEITVEHQDEHDQDISVYVNDKLRISEEDIESEVLVKAKGIFMWVVLVVELLNQAFDDGMVSAMQDKLSEIPDDLDEVLRMILEKDNPYKKQTLLLLQWVLFTCRPLKPLELYHCINAGADPAKLKPWEATKDTGATIKRFITTISRGLVEYRSVESKVFPKDGYTAPPNGLREAMKPLPSEYKLEEPKEEHAKEEVQFIHESVNDFLLRNKRLSILDPTLGTDAYSISNQHLFDCCFSYLKTTISHWNAEDMDVLDLRSKYPFLGYASVFAVDHIEQAHLDEDSTRERLDQLERDPDFFTRWRWLRDNATGLGQGHHDRFETSTSMLYALAMRGKINLVKSYLKKPGLDVNERGGLFNCALEAAAHKGNKDVVEILIDAGANINFQGKSYGGYGSALLAAAREGYLDIVQALLKAGADPNAQGRFLGNPLQAAVQSGSESLVRVLLTAGANVNASPCGHHGTALTAAAAPNYRRGSIVRILLDAGAHVNRRGGFYGTALHAAISGSHNESIVKMLLAAGADINAQGRGGDALELALDIGNEEVIAMLQEAKQNSEIVLHQTQHEEVKDDEWIQPDKEQFQLDCHIANGNSIDGRAKLLRPRSWFKRATKRA